MNGCTAEPAVGGGLGGSGLVQELQPTEQQPHLAAAAASSVFETHYTNENKGRGAFCLGTGMRIHRTPMMGTAGRHALCGRWAFLIRCRRKSYTEYRQGHTGGDFPLHPDAAAAVCGPWQVPAMVGLHAPLLPEGKHH